MSRRRYLSTDISTDTRVNRVAVQSDFAALLYTWMIPHCGDDASIRGDAEKIMLMVMPGRRDKSVAEFEAALQLLHDAGLIAWDRDGECVDYPASAFYKHQSYIKDGERRGKHASAAQPRETPPERAEERATDDNSAEQRKSAQNAASFSLSSSFSVSSPVSSPSPNGDERRRPPKEAVTATRIPEEFAPDEDMTAWARSKGFSQPEIDHHTEAFTRYFRAEAGPKSRKRDWRQAWQGWLLRETPGKWPGAHAPTTIGAAYVEAFMNGAAEPPKLGPVRHGGRP